MTEETEQYFVGGFGYFVPRSLVRELRAAEGHAKNWQPELKAVLRWLEDREPATPRPAQYARVHMLGHQTHVGQVTDLGGGALLVRARRFLNEDGNPRVHEYTYRSEAAGRYGVTYLSAEEWTSYCAELDREVAKWVEFAAEQKRLAAETAARKPPPDVTGRLAPPDGYYVEFSPFDAHSPSPSWSVSWGTEKFEQLGVAETRDAAVAACREDLRQAVGDAVEPGHARSLETVDDGDIPSDATAEAPAAESVERLDFSKPPPGCVVHDDAGRFSFRPGLGLNWHRGYADEPAALAAAWAHYKARHDPPGMWVRENDFGVNPGGELAVLWEAVDQEPAYGHATSAAEARAAAWAWYERRLKLADMLERDDRVVFEPAWVWPRCLTWSDQQVAAVERWLENGGELPEVLRG